jgi:hypothetical protein
VGDSYLSHEQLNIKLVQKKIPGIFTGYQDGGVVGSIEPIYILSNNDEQTMNKY